jgi:murein DD-endopeptidase MepM/ murein hydrolase activator NlpD
MPRTLRQRQRRVAAAIATSATISVGGIAASLESAAGDPLALPPATTIPGPIGPIPEVDLLPTTTTSTTTPASPTTTVASTTTTTTTTVPSGTQGGGGETSRSAPSGGGAGTVTWTELPGATKAAPPVVPAPRMPALPAIPVSTAVDAGSPAPPSSAGPLRSPVLRDDVVAGAPLSLPAVGRSTKVVLNILFGLELPPATLAKVVAPFPVAGEATYADDWHAPRSSPEPHVHEGADVFAAKGTPVVAAADGVVSTQAGTAVGGNALRLTEADGTFYYYAHLDRFAVGLEDGGPVEKGDIIGFVGATGNAEGGSPHLHFEIHPRGGEAVPPVPYLDRWLSEAIATASTLRAQPGAADSVVTLRATDDRGRGKTVDPLLRRASSERPLPEGTTLDPSSGLEISAVVLFLLWMFRRFRRRLAGNQAG